MVCRNAGRSKQNTEKGPKMTEENALLISRQWAEPIEAEKSPLYVEHTGPVIRKIRNDSVDYQD